MTLAVRFPPKQERARQTQGRLLDVAGELLAEVGIERISTNMIAARAGLTPPALYRYFPNKYAVLKELGDRLMRAQDDEVLVWVAEGGLVGATFEERLAKSIAIQERMVAIHREFPGGIAIGRALRAVPLLNDLRIRSRDMVAGAFAEIMRGQYPGIDERRLQVACRLIVELGYSASEMVVEEPDRDADIINREICVMFARYFEHFN